MSEDVKNDEIVREDAVEETDGHDEADKDIKKDSREIDYQAELERLRDLDRKKSGALKEERERRKQSLKILKSEKDETR